LATRPPGPPLAGLALAGLALAGLALAGLARTPPASPRSIRGASFS